MTQASVNTICVVKQFNTVDRQSDLVIKLPWH